MIVKYALYISLTSFISLYTAAVTFEDCGSSISDEIKYSVSNCAEEDERCSFVSGSRVSLNVTFIPLREIKWVTVKVTGRLLFFNVPFSLDPPDACGHWNLQCPMRVNSVQMLHIELPIRGYYPHISVGVKVQLMDETGNSFLCFSFPAKIVSSD